MESQIVIVFLQRMTIIIRRTLFVNREDVVIYGQNCVRLKHMIYFGKQHAFKHLYQAWLKCICIWKCKYKCGICTCICI